MSMAKLPTPPVAPLTRIGPRSGRWPLSSMRSTASAAVNPAVPIAMLSRSDMPSGSGNQPVPRRTHVLGVASVEVLAQTEAGDHHRVALGMAGVVAGMHDSGHVDSADHREPPHDLARPGGGQRVLVVDARPRGSDDDLAVVQVGEGDALEAPLDLPLFPVYAIREKRLHVILLMQGFESAG